MEIADFTNRINEVSDDNSDHVINQITSKNKTFFHLVFLFSRYQSNKTFFNSSVDS